MTAATQLDLFGDAPAGGVSTRRRLHRPTSRSAAHHWFFALRPAAPGAERIAAFAGTLVASHGLTRKPVGAGQLHISLDPVCNEEDAAALQDACRSAATIRRRAFDVRLDTALTFRAGSRLTLVLTSAQGLDAVRALRQDLGCALADEGFRPRPRYTPHMTLCYGADRPVAATPIGAIDFRVAAFALIKGHVGSTRHETVATWPLID